jgi:hypothetical protein
MASRSRRFRTKKKTIKHHIRKAIRMKPVKIKSDSEFSKKQIFLDLHDEEKILLFVTGILFGIGMTSMLLNAFWFTALSILIFGLIMIFIELRR